MASEFAKLKGISNQVRRGYANRGVDWKNSPFEWILTRPAPQRGRIGKALLHKWLQEQGFVIEKCGRYNGMLVNGHRVAVKFSMLWENGNYVFQQIRDEDYDFLMCLGVSPNDGHCWLIPKAEVMLRSQARDGIHPQHKGAQGIDTAWMSIDPEQPLNWAKSFGGSFSDKAITKVEKFLRDKEICN